ncbi:OmpA family protein [soil metagenome]
MKTKFPIYIFTILLAAGCSNKMFKEAEKAYNNEQFSTAAKIYENVIAENPEPEAMLHLADCYRHLNRHAEAEKWYSKSISSKEATSSDILAYAEVLKEEGKYDEASSMLDAYLAIKPHDVLAENMRESCKSGNIYEKADPFYVVEKIDFGFTGSCFSPSKIGNDLLITASAETKPGSMIDNNSGNGFLDLYQVSITPNKQIADAANNIPFTISVNPIAGSVNSNLHEGVAVLSETSNKLYFTRSSTSKNKTVTAKDMDNHLEICTAENVNGNWGNIQSLPFNNKEYSVGHPAISSNGTRLFFISDMPGGFGGTDIYYSDLTNGVWSKPVNAGSAVNTEGNEMFPTIKSVTTESEEFYYSTDGLPGAGGLDIFHCKMENGLPVNPERLKAPFNSSYDDFGIMFESNGTTGYFSSNRESVSGKDDVYRFTRLNPKFFVHVHVQDKETGIAISGAHIEVKNENTGIEFLANSDADGSTLFSADSLTGYSFCIRDKKYFACFGGLTTKGFTGKFNDTAFVVLNVEKIVIDKAIRLENIYYDYNKWNIRPEAAVELDKLVKVMTDNPQIKIELSSHTDSRGSDKYNMTLSGKRAQSAVDYIVSKGISKDRITAKGDGETKPLNKCINGVKCTEEEYQFNRRTEFKVTKITE